MKRLILSLICVGVLITAAAVGTGVSRCADKSGNTETYTYETQPDTEPEQPFSEMSLGDGITVTSFFPYTGIYVEDGSDTTVTNVAACCVENKGTDAVQLLVFSLRAADGENYIFEVSTLLPGQRVNVLEKDRVQFDESDVGFTVYRERYAVFQTEPSLHAEEVQIFCSGSTIRLTNLTDSTMETCRVYFKYKQNGTYIGGVTFSVKVTDLKPGEPATLTPSHYSEDNCEILFVTYE